jgi:hypothetical protein
MSLFAVCSMCRKPIAMGSGYYRCSVSTCNSGRVKLMFCSMACWDAHLPTARHRNASAIEEVARPNSKAISQKK